MFVASLGPIDFGKDLNGPVTEPENANVLGCLEFAACGTNYWSQDLRAMNAAHAIQSNEVAVGPAEPAGDFMLEKGDRTAHKHSDEIDLIRCQSRLVTTLTEAAPP